MRIGYGALHQVSVKTNTLGKIGVYAKIDDDFQNIFSYLGIRDHYFFENSNKIGQVAFNLFLGSVDPKTNVSVEKGTLFFTTTISFSIHIICEIVKYLKEVNNYTRDRCVIYVMLRFSY